MRIFSFFLTGVLLLVIAGCSSGSPSEPGDSYDSRIPDTGHVILQAGTIEIDVEDNSIDEKKTDVNPFHNSVDNLLTDQIEFSIVNYTNPNLTVNLNLNNPFTKELFDMRIIFIDLSGSELDNYDGYTNFYSNNWDNEYHPFIYLCNDFPLACPQKAYQLRFGVNRGSALVYL
jgi:hypothetical protein